MESTSLYARGAVVATTALAAAAVLACEDRGARPGGIESEPSDSPWARTETFDRETEELRIRSLGEAWTSAVEQGDVEWIEGLYTEDATLMMPGRMQVEGESGAREVWSGYLQQPQLRLTLNPEQIHFSESGDLAYDLGTYRLTAEGPATDGTVEDRGQYLVVWRRMDGDWRVAANTYHSTVRGEAVRMVPSDSLPPLDGRQPELDPEDGA